MPEARRKLNPEEVELAISGLAGWTVTDGKLHRVYRFGDFVEAWAFMTASALRIQQMDHHPEWSNVYGTVTVNLVTHDVGGISRRDIELAEVLESLAARWLRG